MATPGTPIVVGDYTYCYIGEKIRKFRNSDGIQLAEADAPGEAMFFINLAYGDGKIFVPRYQKFTVDGVNKTLSNVIAYDADTLKQLFVTEPIATPAQAESQTFYHDWLLYTSRCV